MEDTIVIAMLRIMHQLRCIHANAESAEGASDTIWSGQSKWAMGQIRQGQKGIEGTLTRD